MNLLREKAWSPYLAGAVIGLLQIPGLLVIESPIGASSSYVSVSAWAASVVDGDISSIDYMDKYMTSMKYLWQGTMVVAIAFGAWISVRLSGARRRSFSPVWTKAAGMRTFGARAWMAFLGGFLMLFGARWAGGCTSGHGLSGVGQLAIGSFVVTICFFLGGIAVARLFRKV